METIWRMGTAKRNKWRENPAGDSLRNNVKGSATKLTSKGKNQSSEINLKNVKVLLKTGQIRNRNDEKNELLKAKQRKNNQKSPRKHD